MSEGTRTLPGVKYLSEVRQELRRVSWPSRQQTIQKTILVISVSLAVGVYIGVLDFIFTRLMTILIG
ncbi:preprotein translocase subunit SecE [Patescibacteria group bacterium]|nr:preprotein translocase subunit SecE [Patescibacteria group bacterium]